MGRQTDKVSYTVDVSEIIKTKNLEKLHQYI